MVAAGLPSTGSLTTISGCQRPTSSNCPKSGATWFIVAWQLAQTTDETSRKSTLPPVAVDAMLSNGHGDA
jgi:hypothetical protein